jgi:hypothetical protein
MSALRTITTLFCALVLVVALVLLGVAVSISTTVLNAGFVVSELNNVPVHSIFADQVKKQVPPEAAFLLPIIDEAAVDLEPWAKEQMAVLVEAASLYIKGHGEFNAGIASPGSGRTGRQAVGFVRRSHCPGGGQPLPGLHGDR